ncbi:amidase [Arthrobacter sp. 08Y14]|uniref:amidase n=1 Tax=Arthrobacter sp. 08Y14 TaxID=2058885 RepID=UPI000CE4F5DE|nr:amidase [Arthrobacter sp. 08Y14]
MYSTESEGVPAFVQPASLFENARESGSVRTAAAAIKLINEHDRLIHAFVPEADRSEKLKNFMEPAQEPSALLGAPVGVKDIIRVDGFETRAGSGFPPEALAGPQASLVGRLQKAGAIVVGKTVTAEFAISEPGPTLNPRDRTRTPGGSSSGSAAAVAAGMVPIAVGTQTVGSIIRPAAFCGVVGFRPTWGAIPTDGVIPNAPSLDTVGLFASDLDSIQVTAGILCGWTGESRPAPAGLPVLGIPTSDYLRSTSPPGLRAFEHHMNLLRDAGYEIRERSLTPDIAALHRNLAIFQRYELAQVHASWWMKYSALYRPRTAAAIQDGQRITSDQYRAATSWRATFRDRLADTMSATGIDIWVTPSAAGLPPLGLSSTGDAVMSAPFSFAGLPAVSLPAPNPQGGMCFGLQCVAAAHQDRELLTYARRIAAALDPDILPSIDIQSIDIR